MFEEDTVDISCPSCGHRNSLAVRDIEDNPEQHIVCEGCKAHVKVEAQEFRGRLEQIRNEVKELERSSEQEKRQRTNPKRKDNGQI